MKTTTYAGERHEFTKNLFHPRRQPAGNYVKKSRENTPECRYLTALVRKDFQIIPDARASNATISLDDALMSALAMFQLKDPSLLDFDKRRREEPENLHTVFGISNIPCDSQMRTLLDPFSIPWPSPFFERLSVQSSGRFSAGRISRKVIVVEDGLSSNGPHIRDLQQHNLRFILGAKPGDHETLFTQLHQAAAEGKATDIEFLDPKDRKKAHFFRFMNQVSLNKTHPDLLINVLEYWQIDKDEKITKFSWVTDIPITEENVFQLMRAGRARWKVENETFNTLKNQGYNLGHNYGLGKKNLSAVFAILMMLAFLINQVQQLSCWLFQEALQKAESKRDLWESIRGVKSVLA